ncbi:uncharacterized protein F4807DRAFT_92399 [Annulohypoxylon truncatum]|uniref:uncharacterized protein n=1 Tax=Annulohypoxylon truncatum TaxID=327061 RepID=UPI002008C3A0|nr:uncharacterized protein F4807DRAFT_92399 [Annulohypoxylon truncatum]KAI1209394.1 hypothetical protein F4807DRAFT_92399 [Annulohypoxylon truncatum]
MAAPSSWSIPQEFKDHVETIRADWLSKGLRDGVKRQARNNQLDQILSMFGSFLWNIEDQFKAAIEAGVSDTDWKPNLSRHLRILWAHIYTAARFCNVEYRDRLVVELMLLHGVGGMTCIKDNQTVVASMADRVLWTDMPFFAEEMLFFWNLEFAVMSRSQRRNLHYVLATVAGGNIVSDKLSAVGILVLREAFETPREMGSDNSEDGEDENRTIRDLTVLDLLGCAEFWLLKARDPIMRLSANNFSDYPQEVGRLGPLAQEAGVPDNGGLSQERWFFWKRRHFDITCSMRPEGNGRVPQERWPDSYLPRVPSPGGEGI